MRFYIRKDVFMRKNKTALFLAAVSLSAFFAVSSPGAQEDASRFVDGTRTVSYTHLYGTYESRGTCLSDV